MDGLEEPIDREDKLRALELEGKVQEKKFRLDLLKLDRRRQGAIAKGYRGMKGALGNWIDDFNVLKTILEDPEGLLAKAFNNPPLGSANARAWRAAEIPSANGHTNAHSLARIYAALSLGGEIDGVRLLSPEAIERAREEQVHGTDRVLTLPTRLGLGFFLPTSEEPVGPNPRVFGHGGAGGSYGMADPESRMSFGYVMNLMHTGAWLVDPRPRRLLAALYGCL